MCTLTTNYAYYVHKQSTWNGKIIIILCSTISNENGSHVQQFLCVFLVLFVETRMLNERLEYQWARVRGSLALSSMFNVHSWIRRGSIERTTLLAVEPNNQAKIEFHILCIKIASRNINNKGKLINRNYSTHTSTSTSTFHVMNIEHWTEWTSRRRISASVTSLLLAQWTDTLCV